MVKKSRVAYNIQCTGIVAIFHHTVSTDISFQHPSNNFLVASAAFPGSTSLVKLLDKGQDPDQRILKK